MSPRPEPLFVGNALWIDFVNTRVRDGDALCDVFADDEGIRGWFRRAALAAPARADLARVWPLRDDLTALFEALRTGSVPGVRHLRELNRLLADRRTVAQILVRDGAVAVHSIEREASPLTAIAHDVASTIPSIAPGRLRRCENPACAMVFWDTSRNGTRRFCTPEICGNRIRVARHYRRHRGEG